VHIPSLTPIPLLGSMATNRHSARELAADYGDTQLIAELSGVSLEFTPDLPRHEATVREPKVQSASLTLRHESLGKEEEM